MAQLYIGLISGTSMDAVDAALVDLEGFPHLLASRSRPFDPILRKQLIALTDRAEVSVDELVHLDAALGHEFAAAALALLEEAQIDPREVRAIGSHGQTVRHLPTANPPGSLQVGDANIIAQTTGITTVADFRRRDIAAGGQGAPLVPPFHDAVLRTAGTERAVLNLGGIANITVLPGEPGRPVIGFDSGPGNTLMDRWARRHLKAPLDRDGQWAGSGRVDDKLLEIMLRDSYFERPPPKSTGTEYFNGHWLERALKRRGGRLLRKNVQATLCELTAATIAQAVHRHAPDAAELLVCGGGAHNLGLLFRLQMQLEEIRVRSTEDVGLPPDWVEAMAFAWLARRTVEGKPGNLPSVTGASQPVVLGGIYTGSGK